MISRGAQIVLLLLLLAVCAGSFFLPAFDRSNPTRGYMAAAVSISVLSSLRAGFALKQLYLGSFWIANLFMLASPVGLWRARRGRGGVFLALMTFWDLLTLSFAVYSHFAPEYGGVLIGWCVWEATLVLTTLLLFAARRQARRSLA